MFSVSTARTTVNFQRNYLKYMYIDEYSTFKLFGWPSPSPVLRPPPRIACLSGSAFKAQSNLWPSKAGVQITTLANWWVDYGMDYLECLQDCMPEDHTQAFQLCHFVFVCIAVMETVSSTLQLHCKVRLLSWYVVSLSVCGATVLWQNDFAYSSWVFLLSPQM